ncbi:response regulator transcription factor [Micromonospora peucetia]|uniref:DNA-binding response regulator, NarL/FixJ family, contains REC and HTH domains n=1 Tax=Micromonospora peucetia TaxID=47871 RepID=A0A1C6UXT8_9ACTN|nr:response regulator transcription factor [Micromonospora peucetia]MCX4387701.1 response regulator transcription factor [Micromonospora peucetia]WSA35022.1 response regulator transcription factor [Micromonospora peucetia]SCL58841.1 DNA-binding response regulator, NarL/FixJ family, contains REC and HTH domains [Micromonospora peucetia]
MTVTVAVVDDRSLTFRGVVEALERAHGVTVAGVFSSVESVAGLRDVPTVVVTGHCYPELDTDPPWPEGLAFVVLGTCREPSRVRAAMSAGALAYLDRDVDEATLLAAVHAAGRGDLYLAGSARIALLAEATAEVSDGAPPALTTREREVLWLVAEGLTHQQIARRLCLSKSTVDTYTHRLRQKTGAVNKAGLTRVAMTFGLEPAA